MNLFVCVLVPMIFCVLSLCMCAEDLFPTLKQKIQRLHELTRFSTYYELFGVREGAPSSEIKKAFRRLKKLSPPPALSREQYDELLMNGYNVLNNYRTSYDRFLRNSGFYFLDEPSNYRNHFLATSIALICALVCLDFIVYAFRYLKYVESESAYKKTKRSGDTKADKPKRLLQPVLYSAALVSRGSRLIGIRK